MWTSSPAPAAPGLRVLVSARRLRDLKAAPEDVEIEAIAPIERTARALQTPEMFMKQLDEKQS